MKKGLLLVLIVLLAAGTAHASWTYWKAQDVGGRVHGVAVKAEDDVAVGNGTSPYAFQWYHNIVQWPPGNFSCEDQVWICPCGGHSDTINVADNWGVGIDGDFNVYMANRDPGLSVLVYDYNCNEVDRLETGLASYYLSAVDVDANGYLYVAHYLGTPQVYVYPPMPWCDTNHLETPLASFDAGAYVTEGMCVNAAGTVVYQTNRSAPPSLGWCARFTAPGPAGPWTQDTVFAGDGFLDVEGYVRGVDLDEVGNRIFVCSDNNWGSGVGELIVIADATSGAVIETLFTSPPGHSYHTSPYDVEFDPVGNDLYITHYYGWWVAKWHEDGTPWAVTMSSFTAQAGQEMVELSWRVESEIENKGFNIYRDDQLIAFVESRGATDAPRTYTWIDRDVTAGVTYSYKIGDVELDGTEHMHDFEATATPMAAGVPTTYWLSQNYPNPFNADTHIEFTLANAGNTTLKIYNTTGQLVRTLVDEHLDASHHKVRWDGRGESDELVASGVYFYRLASGTFTETKKMTFLR
jgi:DNA-binding beta-propeller fold protein YncE